jgi:SAM-dependent methyltransferase
MVKCRGCGLIYKTRQSATGDLPSGNKGDGIDLVREERVGEHRKKNFISFLMNAGPSGRLLDVGCGCGFFLKAAQDAGWEVIGIDLNAEAISYATKHLQVNALLGNLRDIDFRHSSFDLVTLWNVLDHTSDPLDLLVEVRRVLNDDGLLFIRTPNAAWHYLNFLLTSFLRGLGWGTVVHRRPRVTFIFFHTNFSRFTLRLALARSGFIPLSIRNSPPVPGDPYLGLGRAGEQTVALAKRVVHGVAQTLAFVSASRLLIGPSFEAWGRKSSAAMVDRVVSDVGNLIREEEMTAEPIQSQTLFPIFEETYWWFDGNVLGKNGPRGCSATHDGRDLPVTSKGESQGCAGSSGS